MPNSTTPYEPALRLQVGIGYSTPSEGCLEDSPDRRRTIRPNGTPDWHLLIILEGDFMLNPESDHPIELPPRSAVLFPPHVTQDYMLNEKCDSGKTFWAHFFPEASMLELLDWPKITAGIGGLQWHDNKTIHQEILDASMRCIHYFDSDYNRRRTLSLLSLEETLRLISQTNPQAPLDALDDRVAASIQFIAQHITTPLSLEDVASSIGLSTSRLSHIFITNLNCSVMSYIEKQRIQLACGMLTNSQIPISQIADNCGFSSAYYFSKRFRKIKNMSPTDYRLASHSESQH